MDILYQGGSGAIILPQLLPVDAVVSYEIQFVVEDGQVSGP